MRHSATALSLVLLMSASACGGHARGSSRWIETVDTLPDGARHVVNTPPVDLAPRWTMREELRIGSATGSGPASFGQIKGLTVLDDGRMAVLDAMAKEVRVFDPNGTYQTAFGREGEGPGEFKAPFGLMRDSHDRLWVADHDNARLSVFDPASGFIATHPWKVMLFGWIWGGVMTDSDRIVKRSITLAQPRKNVLRVWDSTMTLVDSLPLPTPSYDRKNPPGSFYWERPDGRMMGYVNVPFYAQAQLLLDPRGGIWSTSAGDPSYRIAYWKPGGDTTLVIETHRSLLPVSDHERDSVVSMVEGMLKRYGVSPRENWSKIPPVKPAIESMFLSDEGELWVETRRPDGRSVFDRYTRDGTHVATVSSPRLRLVQGLHPVVRGDRFWAVVTDSMGVDYVVRERIVPVVSSGPGSPAPSS